MIHTTSSPSPTTHYVVVDMGRAGLITQAVDALSYDQAYRGAVEQLLLEPEATLVHGMRARLTGDM